MGVLLSIAFFGTVWNYQESAKAVNSKMQKSSDTETMYGKVTAYVTVRDTSDRLAKKQTIAFEKQDGVAATILINPAVKFHKYI